MLRLAKAAAREIALHTPLARSRYLEWEFLRRKQTFKGIYSSFAAAMAAAPQGRLHGYNHQEVAHAHGEGTDQLNQADYPVLFWLERLLPATGRVFDLGGNLGVAFYAYRKYLNFPDSLRWTVCEVSATVAAGARLAQQKGASQLAFTNRREEAEGAGIYFSAGALQYIEEPFAEIISGLSAPPPHLLLQRVPLSEGLTFITLQNNGEWVVPYRVMNEQEFTSSMIALGYDLIDHWKIPRSLEVIGSPAHRVESYRGMYYRRR